MPAPSPPPDTEELQRLAIELARQGRYAEAEQAFTRALALDPASPDILHNLGLVHQMAGHPAAAIECYQKLLSIAPPTAELLVNIGNAYAAVQRVEDAIAAYRRAVDIDPASALALNNLGLTLARAGRPAEAADAYERAIEIAPGYADPLINLAQLHLAAGRLIAPADLLERALGLRPDLTDLHRTLAQLYELRGDIDAALVEREAAMRSAADRPDLHRELILDLNFADGDDGGRVASAARDWHRHFAPSAATPLFRNIDRDPDRRLRLGYIGGLQFRSHTLAHTMLPLVEAHSDGFELTCYSDLPLADEDDVTRRFQRRMDWRRTAGLSDQAFAAAIADDRIDIVIDPVGFVGGSRLLALAFRPAPIQVSFPTMGTCGGATMDYIVADEQLLPAAAIAHVSERVLRVPFAHCFRPLAPLPDISPPPVDGSGVITFGSFNTLPKISRRAIRAWRRILEHVEGSRLLVRAGFPFRDAAVKQHVVGRLAEAGVDVGRVALGDWAPDHRDHLASYNEVDIALDSFPYCGVITTYEALSMGVPVVTRTGARPLDRYSSAILRTVGFADGIAADDEAYVARAVALAADRARLRALRQSLRGMLMSSLAWDAARVASSLETALRSAWRDWCTKATGR